MKGDVSVKTLRTIAKNYQRDGHMPVQNIILRLLYVAGVMGTALIAPKAVELFKYIDPIFERDKRTRRRIDQALSRLRQRGLITRVSDGTTSLTNRGVEKIENILAGIYRIPEPAFWDGKWRIIMFDIPERKRAARAELRTLLQGAGFLRLQDSVWIYPYSCDEFLVLVREHLRSAKGELIYLTADFFDSDRSLRTHFSIS